LKSDRSGFTLMELVIAIFVLMLISVGIFQAIWETYRLRDALLVEGDFYNAIRLSTDLLRRDINMIYSPQIMAATVAPSPTPQPGLPPPVPGSNFVTPQGGPPVDLAEMLQSHTFWGPALDSAGLRPSRFIGTENKLTFVSASNIRVYKDSPESDFAKVTYQLVSDPDEQTTGIKGMQLIKTASPNAFVLEEERDKLLITYPLLRGVQKFRLRYYQVATRNWFNQWDSDREETRNLFPDMIELTLEVNGPQRLSHEGLYLFRMEVPIEGLHASF
jgi:hypothetical protein